MSRTPANANTGDNDLWSGVSDKPVKADAIDMVSPIIERRCRVLRETVSFVLQTIGITPPPFGLVQGLA